MLSLSIFSYQINLTKPLKKQMSMKSNINNGIVFIFSPIIAFIRALGDAYNKNSKLIIVLFCAIVGWSMYPYDSSFDLSRYYDSFGSLLGQSEENYMQGLRDFLSFSSTVKDYYFETVVFLVTKVTRNIHYCYLVFGIVFGVFFAGSMAIMTKHINDNVDFCRYYGYLIFLIVFAIPFTLISSVRFWTAAWVGIYVLLQVFLERKYRYILLLPFAVFIHGSFTIFCGLTLIGLLLSLRPGLQLTRVLIILAFVSIPISYLSIGIADSIQGYLPAPLQRLQANYMSEEHLEAYNNHVGTGFYWVANIFGTLEKTFEAILLILLSSKRWKNNDDIYARLFVVFLVLLSFSNFTASIPSLGKRFHLLSMPIFYFLWCVTFVNREYRSLINLIPGIYSFSFVYWIYRTVMGVVGIIPLLMSPFISFVRFLNIV